MLYFVYNGVGVFGKFATSSFGNNLSIVKHTFSTSVSLCFIHQDLQPRPPCQALQHDLHIQHHHRHLGQAQVLLPPICVS